MRVLHVFNEIKFSGAEIMYHNATPMFKSLGIEMVALNSGRQLGEFSPKFELLDVKVYYLPLPHRTVNPFFLYKYFRGVYKLLNDEKIDVLHIHRSTFFLFFAFVGAIKRVKVIRTIHNVFKSRTITWYKAFTDRLIARVILGTKFQTIGESVYQNELVYYKNPTTKVNNWYNTSKFFPLVSHEEKISIRRKLGLPLDSFVVISTGACTCVKNHHDIFKALAIVTANYKCHYVHLGTGETLNEELLLCEKLNLTKDVSFLGNQVNVRDFLVSADAYIMPSMFEGLSIAAIEAMACGLPSILYNSPGLVDLIKSSDNGYLIEKDHKIIAEKIITLIKDNHQSKNMGSRAKAFVEREFSMNRGVQKITDLYNQ